MADGAELADRLARAVAAAPPERPLAGRICEAARAVLGADGASVTMGHLAGPRVTLCATDERSGELEDLQEVCGEGPCLDAFRLQLPVSTGIGQAVSRWPGFVPAAERILGSAGCLWSLPMRVGRTVIGTLSLYRLSGGTLSEPLDAAQGLADAAAALLVQDPPSVAETPAGLGFAARAAVQQAVGKLTGQLGLGPDDAMAVLRSRAFLANAQLAQVARAVLDGTLTL
jgi:hypothetical protein